MPTPPAPPIRNRSAYRWPIALAMLAASGVLAWQGSDFIAATFPGRPRPRDLLFQALPHIDALRYPADLAIVTGLVLLLIYGLRHAREELPGMAAVFAIFYALRATIMVLTPLALAHGDGPFFSFVPITQNGNFPSGHAGAALLCYLLVDPATSPALRRLLLALAAVEWVALIASHSHYSIDIVGGLLLAYFVWREWRDGTLFAPLKRLLAA